jgi:hypothetical protein
MMSFRMCKSRTGIDGDFSVAGKQQRCGSPEADLNVIEGFSLMRISLAN